MILHYNYTIEYYKAVSKIEVMKFTYNVYVWKYGDKYADKNESEGEE